MERALEQQLVTTYGDGASATVSTRPWWPSSSHVSVPSLVGPFYTVTEQRCFVLHRVHRPPTVIRRRVAEVVRPV